MSSSGATYPVWNGAEWVELPIASMMGEPVVVPNVAALIHPDRGRSEVLLQRRDKEGEAVRGLWELPGGRWRPGEAPEAALRREVEEETGLEVAEVLSAAYTRGLAPDIAFGVVHPIAVVNGIEGAYPSLHVLLACVAPGNPRPLVGETAEPTWWPVDRLRRALRDEPLTFVWHTRAMLAEVLEPPGG